MTLSLRTTTESQFLSKATGNQGFSLKTMAEEIRKEYPTLAEQLDDFRCFRDFCKEVISHHPDFKEIPNLEKLTMTSRFVSVAVGKRNTLLENFEKEANDRIGEFKAKVLELMKTDDVLSEGAELVSAEADIGLKIFSDMTSIRGALDSYYSSKDSAKQIEDVEEIYKCLISCFVCILKSIPIVDKTEEPIETTSATSALSKLQGVSLLQPQFTKNTAFIKTQVMQISGIAQRVNPETKKVFLKGFKDVLTSILSCFVLYRLPVALPYSDKPVFFCKFLKDLSLRLIMEPLGMSLDQFIIHP